MLSLKTESLSNPLKAAPEKKEDQIDHAKIATTKDDDSTPKISDSIVDIPPPPPPPLTVKNTSSTVVPVDEDWSIISSSSDIDDERSTTSSFEYQRTTLAPSGGLLTDSSGNDKESLKVPHQRINSATSSLGSRVIGDEQESWSELEDSQNTISTPTDSANGEDEDNLIDVDSKIKFFENLNDSIKSKSNQFYHDFAKVHLDNYINEQQQQQIGCHSSGSDASTLSSSSSSRSYADGGNDLDDTIELLDDGSRVIIGSPGELTNPLHQDNPNPNPNPNPEQKQKQKHKKSKSKKNKKVLIRAVEQLQIFMEAHSDYLYYYMFIALIIGIIPAYFVTNYVLCPKPVKPVSSMDKLGEVWNTLLYEDVSSPSIFGKKQKINKLVKFGNLIKDSINGQVIPQIDFFTHKVNLYTRKTVLPQCSMFWTKTQEFSKSSLKNLGKWWLDYSSMGMHKFDELSTLGYIKAMKYRAVGMKNFGIFCNTTTVYSKIWGKNIIAGSSDVYHGIKVLFKQEKEHAKILSKGFFKSMKVFNEYQKEKVEKGWGELLSFWNSEAPKFRATLDHNSVVIYKNGKKVFNSLIERLTT